MTTTPDSDPAVAEVHRFHDALASWLAAGDDRAFTAIEHAWHPDLTLIDLTGEVTTRAELVAGLGEAGGRRPGLKIEITDVEVLLCAAEGVVVSFAEHHRRDGQERLRRTTAVLVGDPTRPGTLLWRHVHETGAR